MGVKWKVIFRPTWYFPLCMVERAFGRVPPPSPPSSRPSHYLYIWARYCIETILLTVCMELIYLNTFVHSCCCCWCCLLRHLVSSAYEERIASHRSVRPQSGAHWVEVNSISNLIESWSCRNNRSTLWPYLTHNSSSSSHTSVLHSPLSANHCPGGAWMVAAAGRLSVRLWQSPSFLPLSGCCSTTKSHNRNDCVCVWRDASVGLLRLAYRRHSVWHTDRA